MNTFDFITVPIIVIAVYVCMTLLKKAVHEREKVIRFIPLIAAALGSAFGIFAFFALPEIMPVGDAFSAFLVGGASGLAATGSHQIFRQLTKGSEANKTDEKSEK